MSTNEPTLLTFGQLYGKWLDNVSSDAITGHASVVQALQMAQEAGLVIINGGDVLPTFKNSSDFKVELTDKGPVVVVPFGKFPELDNYAGGDLLRYA